MKHLEYIYMFLAALCLGTIGVLVKLIANQVPVMTLNFLRVFIGFLTLLAIVPFIDKKWYKISQKDFKEYFLVGIIYAIAISLYTAANIFTSVQNAVLINYTYPFFVLIFGYFLLRERITLTKVLTLCLAFIGLMIINPFKIGESSFGNLLSLCGAFFYGLLIVGMKKENKIHGIGDVIWFLGFASLVLSPFVFYYGLGNFNLVWVYVLLLGIVSTGFAYLFYNLALKNLEAEIGAIIATIITPLVSIFLAIMFINEEIGLKTIIGGSILIFSGLFLNYFNKNK